MTNETETKIKGGIVPLHIRKAVEENAEEIARLTGKLTAEEWRDNIRSMDLPGAAHFIAVVPAHKKNNSGLWGVVMHRYDSKENEMVVEELCFSDDNRRTKEYLFGHVNLRRIDRGAEFIAIRHIEGCETIHKKFHLLPMMGRRDGIRKYYCPGLPEKLILT